MISKLQGVQCTLGGDCPQHDGIVSTASLDLHTLTRFLRFCRCFACRPSTIPLHPAPPACVYLLCVIDTSGKKARHQGKRERDTRGKWGLERSSVLVVTASSLEKRECRASFPLLNASFNFTAKFAYQKPHLRQLPAFRCISDKFRSKYCTSYIENEPMYLSYAYTIFVRDIFSLLFSSFFFFWIIDVARATIHRVFIANMPRANWILFLDCVFETTRLNDRNEIRLTSGRDKSSVRRKDRIG